MSSVAVQAPEANDDPELEEEDISSPPADVFSEYVCTSLDFGNKHPGLITEAGSLSAVQLPAATYPLRDSLPTSVIRDTKLSSLQLEGV